MSTSSIPQFQINRTVSIKRKENDRFVDILDRKYLILTEDISMSTSVTYKTIGELNRKAYDIIKDMLGGFDLAKIFESKSGINSFKTVLDTIDFLYEAGGYLPSVKYVQAYKVAVGQEPLRFSIPFSFNFGYLGFFRGFSEVYFPIVTLIKNLSSEYVSQDKSPVGLKLVGLNYFDHFQNQLKALFETGKEFVFSVGNFVSSIPFLSNSSNDSESEEERKRKEAEKEELRNLRNEINPDKIDRGIDDIRGRVVKTNNKSKGTFEVSIGKILTFPECNVTDLNYSFSSDVDSEGYPISGRITIGFETLAPFGVNGNVIKFNEAVDNPNQQRGR